MISPTQLRRLVVRPVLTAIGAWSEAAEQLVMGTAAHESGLRYIKQIGGPALGIWQMEPATHDDIRENYLRYRPAMIELIGEASGVSALESRYLTGNLFYGAAMCRVHYLRVPDPLPEPDDLRGLASYWKQHYNTYAGRGTVDDWMTHYANMRRREIEEAGRALV